jgi:hypothetical protein
MIAGVLLDDEALPKLGQGKMEAGELPPDARTRLPRCATTSRVCGASR